MENTEKDDWQEIRKQGQAKFTWGGKWYISVLFIGFLIFIVLWAITSYSINKDFKTAIAYLIAYIFIRTAHRTFLWYSNEKKFKS